MFLKNGSDMDKSKENKEDLLMIETWEDFAEWHNRTFPRKVKNMDSLLLGLEIELLKLGVINEIRKDRPISKGIVAGTKRTKTRKKRQ